MLQRFLSLSVLLMFCISCDTFFTKKKLSSKDLDSIINFSKVDVSPSFSECDSLLDNAKTDCFRNTIRSKIANELTKHKIKIKNSVDETIQVHLLISTKGKVSLQKISASKTIESEIPNLDSLLKITVEKLPKLTPANKRGIPVNTQYQLPIRVKLSE